MEAVQRMVAAREGEEAARVFFSPFAHAWISLHIDEGERERGGGGGQLQAAPPISLLELPFAVLGGREREIEKERGNEIEREERTATAAFHSWRLFCLFRVL